MTRFDTENKDVRRPGPADACGWDSTMTSRPIYLDYNATTPIDPAVREAILPYLADHFGNPSSTHAYGKKAHAAVETARTRLGGLLGSPPDEIVFIGGGG